MQCDHSSERESDDVKRTEADRNRIEHHVGDIIQALYTSERGVAMTGQVDGEHIVEPQPVPRRPVETDRVQEERRHGTTAGGSSTYSMRVIVAILPTAFVRGVAFSMACRYSDVCNAETSSSS